LPSIEKIIKEKNKKDKRDIARKFHNTVSQIIIALSEIFREEYKINKIGFSGGVFQNRLLLETTIPILKERKFEVYTHQKVPTNDGGISLGQMIMGYK